MKFYLYLSLALLIATGATAQDDEKCSAHNKCPDGRHSAQLMPIKVESAGCHTILGEDSPDSMTTKCCDTWNVCHQICGSTRSHCDAMFGQCLDKKCDAQDDQNACMEDAINMRKTVADIGCDLFDKAQDQHCECVKKDRHAMTPYSVIAHFYRTYDRTQQSKINGLVAEAEKSNEAYVSIVTNLHVHDYPHKKITKRVHPNDFLTMPSAYITSDEPAKGNKDLDTMDYDEEDEDDADMPIEEEEEPSAEEEEVDAAALREKINKAREGSD